MQTKAVRDLAFNRGYAPHQRLGISLSLTTNLMQQKDKLLDKSKHKLANNQRERIHTLRSWYGSCLKLALLK